MMNRDGARQGYDLDQLKYVRAACRVPLIASGGAGAKEHFRDAFLDANVDGALAASVFHLDEPQGPPHLPHRRDELLSRLRPRTAAGLAVVHATGRRTRRPQKRRPGHLLHRPPACARPHNELSGEIADLLYHLTVLLHARGLDWPAVLARLHERHRGIGLHPEGANKP